MRLAATLVSCATTMLLAFPAGAVVLYASPTRNTTVPTGTLVNSGWQWQGRFGDFAATPISKKYFITAGHIGGEVGSKFKLNGVSYTAIEVYDDPDTDLRIYKSHKSFTSWAPLHTATTEVGNSAMLFGRGVPRGALITKNTKPKGWEWGTFDGAMSWGQNRIDSTINYGGSSGDFITWTFDRTRGVANEATIAGYDSGGGVFIQTATGWKLAGINYSVDGEFSRTATGTRFNAALFDMGGFYQNGDYVLDTTADKPGRAYATRISSRMNWINGVFTGSIAPDGFAPGASVPEPTSVAGLATILVLAGRRRHR